MKNSENTPKYRIVENCDPYNARKHYNGQNVLQYDRTTPVKWVIEKSLTKEEAQKKLMAIAIDCGNDGWEYEDVQSIRELEKMIEEEEGEKYSADWFVGPGVYAHGEGDPEPVLLEGEMSFWDDSEKFSIEEDV